MVEQAYNLDTIFSSLGDPTRRDIISRIGAGALSVSEIAQHYQMSFAGVAKHLEVLAKAGLVRKSRRGKEQLVMLDPQALATVDAYLDTYRQLWEQRLDNLDIVLTSINERNEHGS